MKSTKIGDDLLSPTPLDSLSASGVIDADAFRKLVLKLRRRKISNTACAMIALVCERAHR